jgi:hypothetical protein
VPFVDGCAQSRPIDTPFPTGDDVVMGELSFGGLAAAPAATLQPDGTAFYKSGAQLPPSASATIRIESPADEYARIVVEAGPPSLAVAYTGCPAGDGVGSWWVGGFLLYGRATACLPLAVTGDADSAARHVRVALGPHACSRTQ